MILAMCLQQKIQINGGRLNEILEDFLFEYCNNPSFSFIKQGRRYMLCPINNKEIVYD